MPCARSERHLARAIAKVAIDGKCIVSVLDEAFIGAMGRPDPATPHGLRLAAWQQGFVTLSKLMAAEQHR